MTSGGELSLSHVATKACGVPANDKVLYVAESSLPANPQMSAACDRPPPMQLPSTTFPLERLRTESLMSRLVPILSVVVGV